MYARTVARMPKLTKKQIQHFKEVLLQDKEGLDGSANYLETQDAVWAKMSVSDERSKDPLEGDTITAERVVLNGLSNVNKAEAEKVLRALAKIEDGTYGTCDNCGKDIGFERLEARPKAVMCVACA